MEERIKKIEELVKIQCDNGNWNYDPYMFGMANGMILVLALAKGEEPQYLEAPKEWLRDAAHTAAQA
jgi:hypothetical protein